MIKKKLIKNIEFRGIATLPNVAQVNYYANWPITLNSDTKTFSFDNSYTYTQAQIDSKIANINVEPNGYQQVLNDIANAKNNINNNEQAINQINRDLDTIKQNEAKNINFVGEIQPSQNYQTNDYGFVGDKWYICLNSGSGDINNKTNWKSTNAPIQKVDLTNYYTKLQTNDLLKPLENRLVSIEGLNANQSQEINTIKQDITRVEGLIPPQVDLTPYATKVELDNRTNQLASKAQVKELYDWIINRQSLDIQDINQQLQGKQDILAPGKNITIEGGIISCTLDKINLDNVAKLNETNTFTQEQVAPSYIVGVNGNGNNDNKLWINEQNQFELLAFNDLKFYSIEHSKGFMFSEIITQEKLNENNTLFYNKNQSNQQLSEKQNKLVNGDDIGINSQNIPYIQSKWKKLLESVPISGATKVVDYMSGGKYLCFQLNVSSHREQYYVWKSEIPQEIKNVTGIRYVESIEYSLLETGFNKYKVFSPYLASISAYVDGDQLVLRNESSIPSYITHIRVKVLVSC